MNIREICASIIVLRLSAGIVTADSELTPRSRDHVVVVAPIKSLGFTWDPRLSQVERLPLPCPALLRITEQFRTGMKLEE